MVHDIAKDILLELHGIQIVGFVLKLSVGLKSPVICLLQNKKRMTMADQHTNT